jgi:hypothetical protein
MDAYACICVFVMYYSSTTGQMMGERRLARPNNLAGSRSCFVSLSLGETIHSKLLLYSVASRLLKLDRRTAISLQTVLNYKWSLLSSHNVMHTCDRHLYLKTGTTLRFADSTRVLQAST